MRKLEGSSIALRIKHHYREAVRGEANCLTCRQCWQGLGSHWCEALSGRRDAGTTADSRHTCDRHEASHSPVTG